LIDLPKALAAGKADGHIRTVEIAGALRGSFAASEGRQAWIGHWSRDESKSRLFRLAAAFFDHSGPLPADESATSASIAIPAESQGAAFDKDGKLWVTGSRGNTWSRLHKLDRGGAVLAAYDVPIGIEGIAFDASGKLWAVTESGTRKYLRWGERFNFPFVFEIDVAKLK
jgi:streptogramin lyase